MPDFDTMNETDVREEIIRPLLHRLGYRHGTANNIRTEQTFRYDKAFLGRKKKGDPKLEGRADYTLEVVGVGKWVVEAKSPAANISRDDVEQAHTYAAHPEVGAHFFMVTNGRSFELYRTSSLEKPLMAFDHEDIHDVEIALSNLVGPDAIRRFLAAVKPDQGKPLARGIGSQARFVSGFVRYDDHASNTPIFDAGIINGLTLPVTGGTLQRLEDGRLNADVRVGKSAAMFGPLSDMIEREDLYDFHSGDEYVSINAEEPTIFQNLYSKTQNAGELINIPGMGQIPMAFGFDLVATTEAIGFLKGDTFTGTMQIDYQLRMHPMANETRVLLEQYVGSKIPDLARFSGGGMFEIEVVSC